MTATGAEFVVLGGGPAGLGAAYRLARAGRSVTVLERADTVGGLAGSFDVAGVRVDHGSHRLHPSTPPPVLATLRALLGEDLQRRPRRGRLRLEGRFVAFPPRPADLARRLPPRVAAGLALDALGAPLRRPGADTFAEVVRASLGPTLATRFYAPYVEKIWGRPATELSGELARRRVGARSPADLVRRALRRDPEAATFWYPRRGFGQIPEVLADAAAGAGAVVRTGAEVVGIDVRPDGATVRVAGAASVGAGRVWSTLPLPVLAGLAGAPDPVQAAAAGLEHRALVLVYLVLGRRQWTRFDAHYFPSLEVPMSRVSEPRNYRVDPGDPDGTTVLCAEVPCSVGDARWASADEDLGAEVAEALARVGLPDATPRAVVTRRVPRAYPCYEVGFERHLAPVEAWVAAQDRILSLGRQGLFAHDNTHHSLATAWAAVDQLTPGGGVDPAGWARAREGFRRHVVED